MGVLVLINAFAQFLGEVAKFQSWQTILQYGAAPFAESRRHRTVPAGACASPWLLDAIGSVCRRAIWRRRLPAVRPPCWAWPRGHDGGGRRALWPDHRLDGAGDLGRAAAVCSTASALLSAQAGDQFGRAAGRLA